MITWLQGKRGLSQRGRLSDMRGDVRRLQVISPRTAGGCVCRASDKNAHIEPPWIVLLGIKWSQDRWRSRNRSCRLEIEKNVAMSYAPCRFRSGWKFAVTAKQTTTSEAALPSLRRTSRLLFAVDQCHPAEVIVHRLHVLFEKCCGVSGKGIAKRYGGIVPRPAKWSVQTRRPGSQITALFPQLRPRVSSLSLPARPMTTNA